MSKEVVIVFDIGKTNKKILLFDSRLQVLHEEETVFAEVPDDDGFQGDDIGKLENWVLEGCQKFLDNPGFAVRGINFTTYGATLMYLDGQGNRLTPVYNYLKPMPEGIAESLYDAHGGVSEFCRRTASPALGMLNSGLQALWLKEKKPDVFSKVRTILHFPQYLSHLLTGKTSAEHTSIGCHTALWDFDRMAYHPWTEQLGGVLPDPVEAETAYPSINLDREIPVGIGIHDSSASLVPYFMESGEEFILISTGTWCISMNPFNDEPLTADQLDKDCLAYMSIRKKPVKSSRLFLGHIHDVNVERLTSLYGVGKDEYKKVGPDVDLLNQMKGAGSERVFFRQGIPENYVDEAADTRAFPGFREAYHRLMTDLADLTAEAVRLIIPANDRTRNLFVTGGFSKNPLFVHLMESHFPDKKVRASEISNATSLGAAIVIWKAVEPGFSAPVDLGIG